MQRLRRLPRQKWLRGAEGFLWLLPFLIPYFFFMFLMLCRTFIISFQDFKIMRGTGPYIGFDNYMFLFTDKSYWQSLGNTTTYVIFSTPVLIIFPLIVALLIEHKLLTARGFFRTTFFAPYVLPVSVVATTFFYVLGPYTGLVNNLLKAIGLLGADQEIYWLAQMPHAWISIIAETAWWTCGYNMVLYIAGMQEIAPQYYESAEIDGAGYLDKIFHITIPLLGRVHFTVLFLQLIASFKIFSQAYLLTEGQPSGQTRTYIQYFYDVGFRSSKFGRASACAIILLLIVMLVSILQTTLSKRMIRN